MTDEPEKKEQKPPKPRRLATSLADLKSPEFSLILEYEDYELEVPIRVPSAHEWNEIGRSVPQPVPPIHDVDNDPGYLQRTQEAQEEITYRRLLVCIQLPVEGDTQEEKIAALKAALGVSAFWQINNKIGEQIAEGTARIVNRSETFHRDGDHDPAGVPGERLDAAAV
jgi:hypothetical protein